MTSRIRTYKILVEGIRFRARHGASKAERGLLQDFVATIEIELPLSALPRTDTLRGVVDYGRLAKIVVDEGTKTSCRLLETLAERLISRIMDECPAISTSVRIKKFGPPTDVSVDAASIELFALRAADSPSTKG